MKHRHSHIAEDGRKKGLDMSINKTNPREVATAGAVPLEISEYWLHTVYTGTAAQLIEAGVLPGNYKFPKRDKDVEFIAANGYEYTIEELYEPRGVYSVSVRAVAPFIAGRVQHLLQGLLNMCNEYPKPERVAVLVTGVLATLSTLPGDLMRLIQVSGSSEDLETMRFRIEGPNVPQGFYSLRFVLQQYAMEAAVVRGELKRPSGYLLKPESEKTPPTPVSVKRRAVVRHHQTA